MNNQPTRVPEGVPTGGQFASGHRPRASVALDEPAGPAVETSAALTEVIRAAQHSTADVDRLTLKLVALHVRETYPQATHLVLAEGDQGDDDVVPERLLDADGATIDLDYDDDLDELVRNLSDRRLADQPVVQPEGGQRAKVNPKWLIDLGAASQLPTIAQSG